MELVSTPLLPEGYKVPASRNEAPSTRLRRLLAEKPYVFAPGVYDPMGGQLVMYHGFDAVYFSGYSFAVGHLGTTDMDLYSSVEIADGARRTVSAGVQARPRARNRSRPALPRQRRARSSLVRVPDGGARADRRVLHRDPQALSQSAVRFQLLVFLQVVQREGPRHLGRARAAGRGLHLHHARGPARGRVRNLDPSQRPQAKPGRGLHGPAAEGVGGRG